MLFNIIKSASNYVSALDTIMCSAVMRFLNLRPALLLVDPFPYEVEENKDNSSSIAPNKFFDGILLMAVQKKRVCILMLLF